MWNLHVLKFPGRPNSTKFFEQPAGSTWTCTELPTFRVVTPPPLLQGATCTDLPTFQDWLSPSSGATCTDLPKFQDWLSPSSGATCTDLPKFQDWLSPSSGATCADLPTFQDWLSPSSGATCTDLPTLQGPTLSLKIQKLCTRWGGCLTEKTLSNMEFSLQTAYCLFAFCNFYGYSRASLLPATNWSSQNFL
jgi:putative component of membrane protein insertase Oxa1/YidC/SpoIIIJ protein YidD